MSPRYPNSSGYRGQNASTPGLQASRAADPDVRQALDALREFVEVKLGTRGDPQQRDVTARDLEQALTDLLKKLAELKDFTGDIRTLRTTSIDGLPSTIRQGGFVEVKGELYYGTSDNKWKKVTLT